MFFRKKILKKLEKSLLVIDKKDGRTSHDEVAILRKKISEILKKKKIKVGHSGTLDPKVTGVLVVGLGKATRVLEYILLSEKKYIAEFLFHQEISENIFLENMKKFVGKIRQLPPRKSAVKREVREREVYEMKVLDFDKEKNRKAEILCSVERGTYIRKLAHDLGEEIGVQISMGDLRRIQAGVYSLENSNFIQTEKFLQKLERFFSPFGWVFYWDIKKYFYSLEDFFVCLDKVEKIKKIEVKKEAVKYILSGNSVRWKNLEDRKNVVDSEKFSLWYKGRVLAVGEKIFENENNKDDEVEILKIKKVF